MSTASMSNDLCPLPCSCLRPCGFAKVANSCRVVVVVVSVALAVAFAVAVVIILASLVGVAFVALIPYPNPIVSRPSTLSHWIAA